jgi:GT2 family glycosyltransferase
VSNKDFAGLKVVIVNWRKQLDTIECVVSLRNSGIPGDNILVVDNGSNDDSFQQLEKSCPDIKIHPVGENRGFTGGYNIGIELAMKSGASEIFLLNNDAIVGGDTIPILLDSSMDVRVPKIYFYDQPNVVWAAGARWRKFPPMVVMRGYKKFDSPRYDIPINLEYATACALLIRSEVFEKVGGFDGLFENYQEDYDFCYRLRKAGFKMGFIPRAKVWHKVSTSFGGLSAQKWWYLGRNSVLFYTKDGRFPMWTLPAFLTWVTIREAAKLNLTQIREFWRGVEEGKALMKHGSTRV